MFPALIFGRPSPDPEDEGHDGIEAAAPALPDNLVDLLAVGRHCGRGAQRLARRAMGLDRVVAHHALDAPAVIALGAALADRAKAPAHG